MKYIKYALAVLVLSFIVFKLITTPSNNRDWNTDQSILSYATIHGDIVRIYNIRNFTYTSPTDFTPAYYDRTVSVRDITRAWYMVEPFSGIPGSAHTLVSFELKDGTYIAISVEIRKEKGEKYHPVRGLFDQYELMYVIGDERDLIKLRSNYRKDEVYLYPVKAEAAKVQALFLDMIHRANRLKDRPEFYNTLTNTCTTNIVSHIRRISDVKISPFNLKVLFPEYSDELAYKSGLIDTDLSFEEARKKFNINERALKYSNSDMFSKMIRE